MTPTRTFVRRLVTLPGAHTYEQRDLAERMRRRLEGLRGAAGVCAVVESVYARTGIRTRHLEPDEERLGRFVDVRGLAAEAAHSLARRAVDAALDDELAPDALDALVVVTGEDLRAGDLPAGLAAEVGMRDDAITHLLTARDASGPAQAIFFAQMLLGRGAARNVLIVAVDVSATTSHARLGRGTPTIAQVMAHAVLSDGAAAVLLSQHPGRAPRFAYRDCTLRTRIWKKEAEREAPSDATGLRAQVIEDLGRWLASDGGDAPMLFGPGAETLLGGLAERDPRLGGASAVGRSVFEENGRIQVAALLWVLARALESGPDLSPAFRLVSLGPGVAATVLAMEGVERHVDA